MYKKSDQSQGYAIEIKFTSRNIFIIMMVRHEMDSRKLISMDVSFLHTLSITAINSHEKE